MSRDTQDTPSPPRVSLPKDSVPPASGPPASVRARLADTTVRSSSRPAPLNTDDGGEETRFYLRFSPDQVIAEGGMGRIRRFHDRFLRRDVVAKALRPDLQEDGLARLRLLREARIQAGLQHPCIVPVYDIGNVSRSDAFFLMALISGMTLQEIIAGLRAGSIPIVRRFTRRRLLESFCRVCLAVEYAHEHGIVHRDLKPENIMMGEYGEVYILDWGVAKQRDDGTGGFSSERESALAALPSVEHDEPDDEDSDIKTEAGTALGTLEYMAPEQYLASSRLDERSDIYALGAILYEILSLQWFREAPTREELARLVRRESLAPLPRSPVDGVSAELDAIWRRATATRPAERYQTARALHDAIINHLDEEREKQRVRDVAMEHARAAALEIGDDDASPEEAEARRARALRRLGQALAVDPSLSEALQALVTDLLKHPAGASAEVREEMLRTEHETAVRSFGMSAIIYGVWLAFLILGYAVMGVLHRPLMLATCAVIALLIVYNIWLWRREHYDRRHMLAVALLSFSAVGLTSAFLGPFVLLPSLATTTFAAFAVTMRSDTRARMIIMGMSLAAVVIPLSLELAGLVPRSYLYEGGKIIVVPQLVALPSSVSPFILGAIAVLTILLSNFHLWQIVNHLSGSERSALTQVHRLRQLLPTRMSTFPEAKKD